MRSLGPILALSCFVLISGCPESHRNDPDGGSGGDGGCSGSGGPLICVSACGGDAGLPPICSAGRWVCPPGTRDLSTCPPGCAGPPPFGCVCSGGAWLCEGGICPPSVDPWNPDAPGNACVVEGANCNGGSTDACGAGLFCTCTSGRWNCAVAEPDPVCWCGREPATGDRCAEEGSTCGECCPTAGGTGWAAMSCEDGRWRPSDCPEIVCPPVDAPSCPVNPERLVGTACSAPGAMCGSICCGSAVVCEAGVWVSDPGVPCVRCDEYPCGGGACREGQYCNLGCGPADGPEYTCVPMPASCSNCDCIPLWGTQSCTMIDGQPHVTDGPICG